MPFPNFCYCNNLNPVNFGSNFRGTVDLNPAALNQLLFDSKMRYYDNMLNTDGLYPQFDNNMYVNSYMSPPPGPTLYNLPTSNFSNFNNLPTAVEQQDSGVWQNFLNMFLIKQKEAMLSRRDSESERTSEASDDDPHSKRIKSSSSSNSALVNVAKKQLGKKEADGTYRKFTDGVNEGKWCAAFVDWCLEKNGTPVNGGRANWDTDVLAKNILKENPHATVFDRKSGKTSLSKVKPGSVIFFSKHHNKNNYTHVGIVEKVEDGTIYTIEGNSSNKVQRRSYDADNKYVQTILKV